MKPTNEIATHNILLLGDRGTGKTSFINKLCKIDLHKLDWTERFKCTLITTVTTGEGMPLNIIDVNDGDLTCLYAFGAHGAFVFFDVTRLSTLDCAIKWKKHLDSKMGNIPIILLANKVDLSFDTLWRDCFDMGTFCKKYGFSTHFEVSVTEGNGVTESFTKMIELITPSSKVSCNELQKVIARLEEENTQLRKQVDTMSFQNSDECLEFVKK